MLVEPRDTFRLDRIVKQFQTDYARDNPTLSTPTAMLGVLSVLSVLTARIDERENGRSIIFPDGGADAQMRLELERWRIRLAFFVSHVADAMKAGLATDPEAVRRSVVEPLIFGQWNPDDFPEDGFRDGFDPSEKTLPDITSPFIIANQVGEFIAFEERPLLREAIKESIDDLADKAKKAAEVALPWALLIGVPLGALFVYRITR